jgi:hypothetical protein
VQSVKYTHRIAISNQRILNVSDTHVRFIAKDYRDRAQKKPVELEGIPKSGYCPIGLSG